MSNPSHPAIKAIRDELHATVDRLLDRWPIVADLRHSPDRERVECETRKPKDVQSGSFWLHTDPTGDKILNPAATWQTDLQGVIATLGRLDRDSARMVGDTTEPTHCPVCARPLAETKTHRHGANLYHAQTCYQRAYRAGFAPARW